MSRVSPPVGHQVQRAARGSPQASTRAGPGLLQVAVWGPGSSAPPPLGPPCSIYTQNTTHIYGEIFTPRLDPFQGDLIWRPFRYFTGEGKLLLEPSTSTSLLQ
jgi:hypothetical protein